MNSSFLLDAYMLRNIDICNSKNKIKNGEVFIRTDEIVGEIEFNPECQLYNESVSTKKIIDSHLSNIFIKSEYLGYRVKRPEEIICANDEFWYRIVKTSYELSSHVHVYEAITSESWGSTITFEYRDLDDVSLINLEGMDENKAYENKLRNFRLLYNVLATGFTKLDKSDYYLLYLLTSCGLVENKLGPDNKWYKYLSDTIQNELFSKTTAQNLARLGLAVNGIELQNGKSVKIKVPVDLALARGLYLESLKKGCEYSKYFLSLTFDTKSLMFAYFNNLSEGKFKLQNGVLEICR